MKFVELFGMPATGKTFAINSLKKKMEAEAKKENFMQAALMRDEMFKMKKLLLDKFD